jgi:hypothetical protein
MNTRLRDATLRSCNSPHRVINTSKGGGNGKVKGGRREGRGGWEGGGVGRDINGFWDMNMAVDTRGCGW